MYALSTAFCQDQPCRRVLRLAQEQLPIFASHPQDIFGRASIALGIGHRLDKKTFSRYKEFGIDRADACGESHYILPGPAAFVIGTDGVIAFEHINPRYRVRVDPEILLVRLSENAHLPFDRLTALSKAEGLRYPHPLSLRRTLMYASFRGISEALHLDIFHQPQRSWFFDVFGSGQGSAEMKGGKR